MAELSGTDLLLVDNVRKKRSKKERKKTVDVVEEPMNPGVVYIGHIPHGFYEREMEAFFSQFGDVKRVKISRNKKTGKCRGYGFVKFACDEVAKIVAQTMNNYLMFNKLLKCQYVDPSREHPGMVGGRRRTKVLRTAIRLKRAQRRHNKVRNTEEHKRRLDRILARERKKRRKLEALGIEFEFPGYSQLVSASGLHKQSTHTVFVVSDSDNE